MEQFFELVGKMSPFLLVGKHQAWHFTEIPRLMMLKYPLRVSLSLYATHV